MSMIRITSIFLNPLLFNCKNDLICRDHPDQVVEWLVCTKCQLRLPDEFALKNHSYHVHPTKKRGRKRNKRVDVSVLCQFCAQVLPNQEVWKEPYINVTVEPGFWGQVSLVAYIVGLDNTSLFYSDYLTNLYGGAITKKQTSPII